jgi:hypothetical protein
MRPPQTIRCFLPASAVLMLALGANPARAQVREVVVGITTTCPYENAIEGGCWSGAYHALLQLDGVKSVDKAANGYNCTARVYLSKDGLPDPDKWAAQFKKSVDQAYTFRGVEITASGTVSGDGNGLVLRIEGIEGPIALRALEHKLQWNSKKATARQPEPDEREAHNQLASRIKDAKGTDLKVKVTGPLLKTDTGYALEVREFFPLTK